jgi:hypothetical protein
VGQQYRRPLFRQLPEHQVKAAVALHDVVYPRDVQRRRAASQGAHGVDHLLHPALADAAPHEPDVGEVVVVSEDGHAAVARAQTTQRLDEPLLVELSGRVAPEVPGYGDEVGMLLVDLVGDPVQALGLRPVVEVEVAELDDPVAVELRREPRQR